jgi:cytochrome c biogenesis factor
MMAADIAWCIKIFLSFFIIHNNEKTLGDTAIIYLCSGFILDGVSTFPSIFYWMDENPYTISSSFRLLYFAQLMTPFSMALKWSPCMRSYTQHRFNQIFFFISLFFFMLVLAHMCACCWIYIGRLDADLPEDER